MMRKLLYLFGLLLVVTLVAAGCSSGEDNGDDDDDSGDESGEEAERLDEDEFLEQFDEACLDTDDEIAEVQEEASDVDIDSDEAPDAVQDFVDVLSEGIEELEGIRPPEDLQEDVDEILELIGQSLESAEEALASLEDGDEDDAEDSLGEVDDHRDELQELGDDLGLECFEEEEEDSSDDFSDSSDDLSDDFSSDFSDDFSSDFSDDFSDDGLGAVLPADFILEYGSDAVLDILADECYAGEFISCDALFQEAAPGSNYQAYGDTCGGRQVEGTGVFCADAFG